MTLSKPSVIALIVANLLPLLGVAVLEWRVFDVMMLYWAENVVIGGVNILRMLKCESGPGLVEMAENRSGLDFSDTQKAAVTRFTGGFRYFLVPFFAFHYGMFCFGHYAAVTAIFGAGFGEQSLFAVSLADVWQSPMWIGVAAIATSHLVSFKFNFIDAGEYRRTSLIQLMQRPYGRIIALHIAIIAGGFLVTLLDNPMPALLLLIALKIGIDLRMHEEERRKFAVA